MENKYLPIGSVVKISDRQKKLMITGYLPISTNENQERKIWDYCGCLYPEGVITTETNYVFNQNNIEEICFLGLEDDEQKKFQEKIQEAVKSLRNLGNN